MERAKIVKLNQVEAKQDENFIGVVFKGFFSKSNHVVVLSQLTVQVVNIITALPLA